MLGGRKHLRKHRTMVAANLPMSGLPERPSEPHRAGGLIWLLSISWGSASGIDALRQSRSR